MAMMDRVYVTIFSGTVPTFSRFWHLLLSNIQKQMVSTRSGKSISGAASPAAEVLTPSHKKKVESIYEGI